MRQQPGIILLKLMILALCISSCASQKATVRAIRISHHLPLSIWSDRLLDEDKSYEVYYYNDMTMYKYTYTFDSVSNGDVVLEEKRYSFFIFQNDSTYGKFFDSLQGMSFYRRLPVDSVCKSNSFENFKLDTLSISKPDSSYADGSGDNIKMFHPPITKKDSLRSKIFLYYNRKFDGIKETFTRKLDHTENGKLYKVKIAFDGIADAGNPNRQIRYKMEEINRSETGKLTEYFRNYKAGK